MFLKNTRVCANTLAVKLCALLFGAVMMVCAMSTLAYAAEDGGTSKQVDEESSTCTVTFEDTDKSIEVVKGGTISAEDIPPHGNTTWLTFGSMPAEAYFMGWSTSQPGTSLEPYGAAWRVGLYDNPLDDPNVQRVIPGLLSPETVIYEDKHFGPAYYLPIYVVEISILDKTVSNEPYLEGGFYIPLGKGYSLSDSSSFNDYAEKELAGTEDKTFEGYYYLEDGIRIGAPYDMKTPVTSDQSICAVFKSSARPVEIPVAGNTGIKAQGNLSGPNIPEGATVSLSATQLVSGVGYDELLASIGSGTFAGAFEINLSVNGATVHDGFGTLMLSFPVGKELEGHRIRIWHRLDNGNIISDDGVVRDGTAYVTVTSLSAFALEAGGLAEEPTPVVPTAAPPVAPSDTTPAAITTPLAATGDPISASGIIGMLGLSAIACIAAATFAVRRHMGTQK